MGRPAGKLIDVMLLTERREKLGMSQEALAYATGVSVRVVQKAENNEGVSVETVHKLARAVKVQFEQLVLTDVDTKWAEKYSKYSREQLLQVIKTLTERTPLSKDPDIMGTENGSFIIKLRMSEKDAHALEAAFKDGSFHDLELLDVRRQDAVQDDLEDYRVATCSIPESMKRKDGDPPLGI